MYRWISSVPIEYSALLTFGGEERRDIFPFEIYLVEQLLDLLWWAFHNVYEVESLCCIPETNETL